MTAGRSDWKPYEGSHQSIGVSTPIHDVLENKFVFKSDSHVRLDFFCLSYFQDRESYKEASCCKILSINVDFEAVMTCSSWKSERAPVLESDFPILQSGGCGYGKKEH